MIKLAAPGSVRTPMLMADLKPGQESLSGINESLCNATVFGVLFLGCTLGVRAAAPKKEDCDEILMRDTIACIIHARKAVLLAL